jgi:hypothetical protein
MNSRDKQRGQIGICLTACAFDRLCAASMQLEDARASLNQMNAAVQEARKQEAEGQSWLFLATCLHLLTR